MKGNTAVLRVRFKDSMDCPFNINLAWVDEAGLPWQQCLFGNYKFIGWKGIAISAPLKEVFKKSF